MKALTSLAITLVLACTASLSAIAAGGYTYSNDFEEQGIGLIQLRMHAKAGFDKAKSDKNKPIQDPDNDRSISGYLLGTTDSTNYESGWIPYFSEGKGVLKIRSGDDSYSITVPSEGMVDLWTYIKALSQKSQRPVVLDYYKNEVSEDSEYWLSGIEEYPKYYNFRFTKSYRLYPYGIKNKPYHGSWNPLSWGSVSVTEEYGKIIKTSRTRSSGKSSNECEILLYQRGYTEGYAQDENNGGEHLWLTKSTVTNTLKLKVVSDDICTYAENAAMVASDVLVEYSATTTLGDPNFDPVVHAIVIQTAPY